MESSLSPPPQPQSPDGAGTAAARYESLYVDRQVFLMRARECALFTIPTLFPPEGHSGSTRYYTPYQAVGARCVNNLSNKLLLALLPPTSCFFRLTPDPKIEQQLEEGPGSQPDDADLLDEALSDMEQSILKEINRRGVRIHSFEGIKQLVAGGNTLLHLPKKGGMRVFRLDQYVVQRDPEGGVLEIVVKECLAPNTLPDSVRQQVLDQLKRDTPDDTDKKKGDSRTVELFTWIRREDSNWTICQEVKGIKIPEAEGTYPLEKCPWLPLRWTRIDGESYGRGLCEEYIGDLASLENLSKTLVQAGQVAGKVLIMVKPNGTTRVEALADKPNGAVVEGDAEEVTAFHLDKQADLTFVSNLAQAIEQRLSFAFLLNSSIQRDGERVTAEEIRFMAGELEDALGGVYSLLADDFQRPLAFLVMMQMEADHKLPKLPDGTVEPTIVTGLDALGRTHELSKLDQFLGSALQKFGPDVVQKYINMSDYFSRSAASLGLRKKGLVRTEDEVQQLEQQQQQQAMAQQVAPPAINAGAKLQAQAMQQQHEQSMASPQPQEPGTNG